MSYQLTTPIVGTNLTLTKVTADDIPDLAAALVSPTTWFSQTWGYHNLESFRAGMELMLAQQAAGQALSLKATHNGEVVATSRFHSAPANFTRVEIGFTWIADQWQRTFVNTELKLLMLNHAFEVMNVRRVEFAVHPLNEKSNVAMKRIGARLDGTLRSWRFNPNNPTDNGDRNLYSIISSDWAEVKANLQARL